MKFDKPIVSIDVESSGVDPVQDRIVSISAVKYQPEKHWCRIHDREALHIDDNGRRQCSPLLGGILLNCQIVSTRQEESRHWLVNPGRPIPAESTEVHGIKDADVANAPLFLDIASDFVAFIADCGAIVGYNLFRFDILIIQEELSAAHNGAQFPPPGALIIDACNIFHKKEKRDLTAAVAKYCGGIDHSEAHNSLADAKATFAVLIGQLAAYPDLAAMTFDELAKFSRRDDMVDFAGKLKRNKTGDVIYAIGKAKGMRVQDDPSFGDWMLRQAWITADTRQHLKSALETAFASDPDDDVAF